MLSGGGVANRPAGGATQPGGSAVRGNQPSFGAPISLFEPWVHGHSSHSIIIFLAKIQPQNINLTLHPIQVVIIAK